MKHFLTFFVFRKTSWNIFDLILSLGQKCSFSGWGQFLQKLCKNCPHPEKPFSNSKTISQIKFPYRIEKLVKSQQEWPGGKTLCRSLVTCKGFFCPVVLLTRKLPFMVYLFLNDLNFRVLKLLRKKTPLTKCLRSQRPLLWATWKLPLLKWWIITKGNSVGYTPKVQEWTLPILCHK